MRFQRARQLALFSTPAANVLVRGLLGVLLCVAGLATSLPLFADGAAGSGGAGVWLDVPFVKQDKNACGAASIAMVMRYWQQQDGGSEINSAAADPAAS